MVDFIYTTNDANQVAGIAAARADYNKNNPQNLMSTDQDFFNHQVDSQFNQWAAQFATTTATLTATDVQAMTAFIQSAQQANLPGVAEMAALMEKLPPVGG